jgi:glycine amidinotransferase
MMGCMPPRDVLLTVGTEVLEATMSLRSRHYEYLCYRPLLERYYHADPGMHIETAVRPRLTDASYHKNFWDEYAELEDAAKLQRVNDNDLVLTQREPLFDAADICRCGKDMFVQLSLVTNQPAVRWLRRHFPEHRVHAVTFDNPYPQHIDTTWVPLRPGLMLHCGERAASEELLAFMKVNDWEVVSAAPPARGWNERPRMCLSSPWLSMNVLVLDPGTVCVEASESAQAEQLDSLGFEVIPVPFWDVAPFGGGLHCATADVYREGVLEDLFPRRHGRF